MGQGLQRAANAARATRGLGPRPVHLRSNRGDFAACGIGAPSATVWLTDDAAEATCKNCLKVQRGIDRERRAQEVARQALRYEDCTVPDCDAPYDEIKVSAMVTVTLTPEQAQAYADAHGNVFVSMEIRARLRRELAEALEQHPWVRDHMSVEITKPVIVKG